MDQIEPYFLPLSHVHRIHRRSLDEHGGMDGVRDSGAVESALAAGINTWLYRDSDLFDIAAAYAYHLAEAQAFIDGNKRTAIASALHFLAVNGYVGQPDQQALYDAMIAIARRELDKPGLAALLRTQFPSRTKP
jgi:death-on-curing protein